MNKKIQFLIAQYKTILHLDRDDEVWDSSAQKLEKDLKSHGIFLSKPLFYQYKLPNNVTASDYLSVKNQLLKFARYKPGELEQFVSYLSDKDEFKQQYLALSKDEKIIIEKHFVDFANDSNKQIDTECKKIRALNPELQNLDVPNDIEFLSGVVYGFAPAEIKHFINLKTQNLDWKQNREEYKNQDNLAQQIGIKITYRLAPETIEMIRTAWQQQIQQIENARKNNGHE